MAKKPHARHQSARDLLKDIAHVRASLGGTTGAVPVETMVADVLPVEDEPAHAAEGGSPVGPGRTVGPVRKRKRSRKRSWALPLLSVGILVVLLGGAGIAWSVLSRRPSSNITPAPPTPEVAGKDEGRHLREEAAREETLKKSVEQHLLEIPPRPGGVQECIDLGVLYLNHEKVSAAEALFKHMAELPSQSAYHHVGRLGLAVTDVMKKDYSAAHEKLKKLFDPKSKSAPVLKDYLGKNPEFAEWVSWADPDNVRSGKVEPPHPQGPPRGWPTGRFGERPKFRKR